MIKDWVLKHKIVVALTVVAALWVIGYFGVGIPWEGPAPDKPWNRPVSAGCRTDPAHVPPLADAGGALVNYLHTCDDAILDSQGRRVELTGLNWFGMETGTLAPDGLWTRNWRSILDQIVSLGYNTIRLGYSNDALQPGRAPTSINYVLNPDLNGLTSLEVLDKIVDGAKQRGMRVLLDRHRPDSQSQSSLWYTDAVSETQWISDWRMLARRYLGNEAIIGADLHNEPRGPATWGTGDLATDWRLAAERAGNAILEENPYWLVFVEGIEQYNGDFYWWGGNLLGVRDYPVRLQVPNRLVYSPHDYGPSVFDQGWFKDPSFPRNLPTVFEDHWGFIARQKMAPVVVGEFGSRSVQSDSPDGQWQRALLQYLQHGGIGFFVWSLNPNSGDTGGLLGDDWMTAVDAKRNLYDAYLAPPLKAGNGTPFGIPNGDIRLEYRNNAPDDPTANVGFAFRLLNNRGVPLDLSRIEVRYWFSASETRGQTIETVFDYAAVGTGNMLLNLRPASVANQDRYLQIGYGKDADAVPAYTYGGEAIVRMHMSDWSLFVQSNDYSYSPSLTYVEWSKMAVYSDGKLIWGKEP